MPLDIFYAAFAGIENARTLEVRVDPGINGGAGVLCVYTGTLVVALHGTDGGEFESTAGDWSHGIGEFVVPTAPRRWTFVPPEGLPTPTDPTGFGEHGATMTYFRGGTATVALASISGHPGSDIGWAVDGTDVYAIGHEDEGIKVEFKLAVKGSKTTLHRFAYQVTALGQEWPHRVIGASTG